MESSETKCVLLTSSEEENEECIPRIINTISLQGCSGSLTFEDHHEEEEDNNLLYPVCEIKEEKKDDATSAQGPSDTNISDFSRENGREKNKPDKKRIKLTQLNSVKHVSGPKPSSSKQSDSYNVVDARNLALQESLFKTKELFDTFLRVCQDQENSSEMEKVVEKLMRAYSKARQEYLGSLEFQNMLEAETEKVNTSSDRPWLNLKLVLDEMKHNKKLAAPKLKLGESEESQADAGASNDEEPVIECPKKRRHLKKLEKTLRALNLKIKKLEEMEVSWSDDEDSPYVRLDRYRLQFNKVYTKVCEIKGKLPDADRPYLRKVSFAGTTYPHLNRCIERYYNKHRDFPDFQDIKKLVILANQQENIDLPPIKIQEIAAAAFKEFGEMLKRLRQYDDYDVLISYLDHQQVDPAREDKQLQEQLNMNAMLFRKREQEVIDKFAAEEAGLGPDELANQAKKKRILTSPRKKPTESLEKKGLSSSDDSSGDEREVANGQKSKVRSTVSSSEGNSSDDESGSGVERSPNVKRKDRIKKEPDTGKGKHLIGKSRIVKRGKISTKKTAMSKRSLSSDEDCDVKDPKDSFTNYLGLKGTLINSKTKGAKTKLESDEELPFVEKVKRSPLNKRSSSSKNSSDSDSTKKAKPTSSKESENQSVKSNKTSRKSMQKPNVRRNEVVKIEEESNSGSEPIVIVNTDTERSSINKRKTIVKVVQKHIVNPNKRKRSFSSDDSERTSEKESDEDGKKDLSDVELSAGSKDLSSDSSDCEDKGNSKANDVDDSIIVLSEDTPSQPIVNKPVTINPSSKKTSPDSSDSDDIFVLSEETTRKPLQTIAPRKTLPSAKEKDSSRNSRVGGSPHQSTPPRRRIVGLATSTPIRRSGDLLSRRLLDQSKRGSNKPRPSSSSSTSNGSNSNGGGGSGGGKQTTLPQLVNGASRKPVVIRKVQPNCRATDSPETIPLIVLD